MKKTSDRIAFAALIVSVIAIGVSFYTAHLQRRDFDASRSIIVQASLESKHPITEDERSNVIFEALGPDIVLQKLRLYFPKEIESRPVEILGPFKASLFRPISSLGSVLSRAVPDHPPKDTSVGGTEPINFWSIEDSIPVIIDAEYTARGELFHDRSLYGFEFIKNLFPRGKPQLNGTMPQFMGLKFVQRLSQSQDPGPFLDDLMKTKKFIFE